MTPFVGQIEFFAFGLTPMGWLPCDGQMLEITDYPALFSVIKNRFGGDGETDFAVPDLQGRVVLGPGNGYAFGSTGGEEFHTLTVAEMPSHVHGMNGDGSTPASSNTSTPSTNTVLGISGDYNSPGTAVLTYAGGTPNGQMADGTIADAGADQPHEKRMPFLVLNACIAYKGLILGGS